MGDRKRTKSRHKDSVSDFPVQFPFFSREETIMNCMSELSQAKIDAFCKALFVTELIVDGMATYYDNIAAGQSKLIDGA